MKQSIKKGIKPLLYPVARYFGPRFQNIHDRLDQIDQNVTGLNRISDQLVTLERRMEDFERHISTDIQTAVEVLLTHQRSTALLQDRIAELQRLIGSGAVESALDESRAAPANQD